MLLLLLKLNSSFFHLYILPCSFKTSFWECQSRNFRFNLRISCKDLIWCTNYPNVHTHNLRKRCSLVWMYFFSVSVLNSKIFMLMISSYFWNEKVLVNELKKYTTNYPTITLRNKKVFAPVCDLIHSNSFLSISENLTTLRLFFVGNKN